MNQKRPNNFEEDISVPDMNESWQKMEMLLNKEESRRPVAFWLWRLGALGLLLTALAYFTGLFAPNLNPGTITGTTGTANKHQLSSKQNPDIARSAPSVNQQTNNSTTSLSRKHSADFSTHKKEAITIVVVKKIKAVSERIRQEQTKQNELTQTSTEGSVLVASPNPLTTAWVNQPVTPETTTKPNGTLTTDSIKSTPQKKDTAQVKVAEPEPTAQNESGVEELLPTTWMFSAGVGFQQAIAINGQTTTDFTYKGKRASLSDHLPAVYVQAQKGRIIVQAEFQYAVPQPVGSFVFNQNTRFDAASLTQQSSQFTLKKLYYHQLPITVNLLLFPKWSAGSGLTHSILAGAVTEEENRSRNVTNGTETVRKELAPVRGYTDSFLYKTTTGLTFQTAYQWRRLSVGLRFTQLLQPYIRYTEPGGEIAGRKNGLLQGIIRFRLWNKK